MRIDDLRALPRAEREEALDGLRAACAEIEAYFDVDVDRTGEPDAEDAARAYVIASSELIGAPSFLPPGRDAAAQMERAREIARRVGRADLEAHAASLRIASLEALSGPDAALAALDEVLAELAHDEPRRVHLLVSGAKIALAAGRIARAEELGSQAERTLAGVDRGWRNWSAIACATHGLQAEIALYLGVPDRALVHAEREREVAEQARQVGLLERALVHQIDAIAAAERPEAALERIAEALAEGGPVRSPERRGELHLLRGVFEAHQAWGDPSRVAPARESLRLALANERLTPELRSKARGWLAELLRRDGASDEARELLDWQSADAETAPAIVVATHLALERERAEGRVELAELLQTGRRFVQRTLAVQATLPPRPGGLGYAHYTEHRLVLHQSLLLLLELHPGREGIELALEMLLRTQSAGSFARRNGYTHQPLAAVRRALTSPTRGVLVYLPTHLASHVIAFDATGAEHALLPGFGSLKEQRKDFEIAVRRAVRSNATDPIAETEGAALAAALLPAAIRRKLTSWDAVSIVGLDVMGYIPFELLPFEDGYLGDRIALSVLPSLPVGMLLVARPGSDESEPGGVWTIAAPALDPGRALAPLPFEAGDRERLSTPPSAASGRVLDGEHATLEALRDDALSKASLLHVLTHGARRIEPPTAGFLLSRDPEAAETDREVWAEDVETLTVPPVVVLSVCSAARGPLRRGEDEQLGLASAFLQAGARAVLLARDDVEYHACVDLVARFQERLLVHGEPVDEALRHARVDLANDPASRHSSWRLVHAVGWGGVRVR